MKKSFLYMAGAIVVAILIQFVPVERSNPPVKSDVGAPPEVRTILKRACYNCHSNETVWPWYAHIAPVSWLIASDVSEGRENMNFSKWGGYTPEKLEKILKEVREEVEEGEMPPWYYLLPHPEARLSPKDKAVISSWTLGS